MDDLTIAELTDTLLSKSTTPKVLLFDPRDECIDRALLNSISELKPKPVVIDFQQYDLNKRESLFRVYVNLHYYVSDVAKHVESNELKKILDILFRQGLEWAKAGSQIPISNLLKTFMEEFHRIFGKSPWVILANIDVETEVNHATIGSLVFDAICDPYSENVIVSCTLESWTQFEKGHDIFARIASRLRSNVKRLNRGEIT